MIINDSIITVRRTRYACCAMDYMSKYLTARRYGDKSCRRYKQLWLFMMWAKGIADDTPTSTEDFGRCTDYEFAAKVFQKADCFCRECVSCNPPDDPPPPGVDCDIEIAATVSATATEATLPGVGVEGTDYYMIDGPEVGSIASWVVDTWIYTAVPLGEVVDVNGVLWTNYDGVTPGELFPAPNMTLVSAPDVYEVVSAYPSISLYAGRQVYVQAFDGTSWVVVFSGDESDLATPIPVSFSGVTLLAVRATYIYEGVCQYVSPGGTIVPDPGECGTFAAEITRTLDCLRDEYNISIDITEATGWPIGDILVTVNGVQQAPIPGGIGIFDLGTYAGSQTVDEIRIVNTQDSECDYTAGPIGFMPGECCELPGDHDCDDHDLFDHY